MNHRTWMLPKEDRIERRLSSTPGDSSPRPAKRKEGARRTTVLAACIAVAIIASGALLLSPGSGTGAEQPIPATPGDSPGLGIEFPHPIMGVTYDSDGTTPLPFCTVTVTDVTLGESAVVESDADGVYQYDIANLPGEYAIGDEILVEAVNETLQISGSATGVVTGEFFDIIDVTLNVVIPEFPLVITPVVGILALFVVVRVRRKKEEA